MPTHNDETLKERYKRETLADFQRIEREIEGLKNVAKLDAFAKMEYREQIAQPGGDAARAFCGT